MSIDEPALGTLEIQPAPLSELMASVGRGLAAAQRALDEDTTAAITAYSDPDDPAGAALREAGSVPKRHTIPEVEAEVALSLSVRQRIGPVVPPVAGQDEAPLVMRAFVSPVDGRDARRFGHDPAKATRLKFKVVATDADVGKRSSKPTK